MDSFGHCLDRAVFNGSITSAILLAYATTSGGNKDPRFNLQQLFQAPRAVRFRFGFGFYPISGGTFNKAGRLETHFPGGLLLLSSLSDVDQSSQASGDSI